VLAAKQQAAAAAVREKNVSPREEKVVKTTGGRADGPSRSGREGAAACGRRSRTGCGRISTLIKRGLDYLKSGDISAARLVLRRAAQAGNSQAALTLGATFDPKVLADLGVLGFAADVEQARTWYQRAAELGSSEAARRVERLAQVK